MPIKYNRITEAEKTQLALQPPPITYTNSYTHEGTEYQADDQFARLAIALGTQASETSVSQFVGIDHHMAPHRDYNGMCLAYCIQGEGHLFLLHNDVMHHQEFKEGTYLVFDDSDLHFAQCKGEALFLVGNIEKEPVKLLTSETGCSV
jgi:hypothetical protein